MDKDIMKCFIGKVIKVDRGGPESKIGMLLDASNDLIVLLTEDDGVVYYNTKHIKSLTDNIKEHFEFNIEVPKDFKFIKATNFKELLDSLKFKWIKINRGGPDKLEGVLTEIDNDFVFLINNQEIVRLSMFHIKSISYGLKIERVKGEKSDKQQSRQKDGTSKQDSQNKNKNKNKNNKTNSKKGTSQKTTGEDTEMALAYPLSTQVSPQKTVVEDTESDLSIPLSTEATSQITAVEDTESDLSIPLSKKGTSQKTAIENAALALLTPLSTKGTSQITAVEDAESDLSIPLSTNETSQITAVEDAEDDLSVLLSSLEKFLRKYSKSNQN